MESQLVLTKQKGVRVRFAPSPTGALHIGSARTALFNYLWAKKNQGTFVLRIEDTDEERSTKDFEKDILENLKWLGIVWDEGPSADFQQSSEKQIGNSGPYFQSQRKNIYKKHIQKLYDDGFLYWCFCTKEELEAQKEDLVARGEAPRYKGRCQNLSKAKIEKFQKEGKRGVLRFKCPAKMLQINDEIRGKVEFDTSLLGDFVVARDLETPLYNLAVVIDDFEMKINYVIRGEDHLPNTPKQIMLQEAFGFSKPKYAHIPLILAKDKSKLSKRQGSFAIEDYKKDGYLPEAIINFLALLGWNPGNDKEVFSMEDLTKEFSVERIQKAGAVFNEEKLDFVNGYYIRNANIDDLTQDCIPFLEKAELIKKVKGGTFEEFEVTETKEHIDINRIKEFVFVFQERLKKLSEIPELSSFFFKKDLKYDKKMLFWKEEKEEAIQKSLKTCYDILSKIEKSEWNKEYLKEILLKEAEKANNRGIILWPLRVSLTGMQSSPPPFEIAEVLGQEETLERIQKAINLI